MNSAYDRLDIRSLMPGDVARMPALGSAEYEALHHEGTRLLDQVGVLVLCGGRARRFGGAVKAAVEVLPGVSFFQFAAERVRELGRDLARPIPLAALTSQSNHATMDAHLRERGLENRLVAAVHPRWAGITTGSGPSCAIDGGPPAREGRPPALTRRRATWATERHSRGSRTSP